MTPATPTSRLNIAAIAVLLCLAVGAYAEPPPVMAWVAPGGVLATRAGTPVLQSQRHDRHSDELSHQFTVKSARGYPAAVAIGCGRVWVDRFSPPDFGIGPMPVQARTTSWCSADELVIGRVAPGPGPLPWVRIGGPFDIGDRAEWLRLPPPPLFGLGFPLRRDGADEPAKLRATALVPVRESECLRFDLLEVEASGVRRLDCARLKGTPPKEERLGQVAVPFAEPFAVTTAGNGYQFLTASGRLFVARRNDSGLPGEITSVPLHRTRVLGVVTDTRDGAAYLFTKPAGEEIRFKRLDSDAKPVSLPFALPEDFADTIGAAKAMIDALISTKTIKRAE